MFKENSLILFQGDSITDACRVKKEKAEECFNLGGGYALMAAAELSESNIQKKYKFLNTAVSGNRIVDLYARWKKDTIAVKPDVLSVLMGVNDIGFELYENCGVDAEMFRFLYGKMIDEARAINPQLIVILCEPFVLPVEKVGADWNLWKPEMDVRRRIVKELAAEKNAIFVALYDDIIKRANASAPELWASDGIHPTPACHRLISRKWIDTVKENVYNKQ